VSIATEAAVDVGTTPRSHTILPVGTRTVLVIDDDPVIVKLLQVNFEIEGYAVISAENGLSGLTRARDDQPDLIILDVMMPGMNGIDVARSLKAAEETRAIPIILLSAKAQANDVALGLEVADDYITKPFDPLELLDRVAGFLEAGPRGPDGP
jgi:two-component system alkaline phosphatase synthesis response regulator PhoP